MPMKMPASPKMLSVPYRTFWSAGAAALAGAGAVVVGACGADACPVADAPVGAAAGFAGAGAGAPDDPQASPTATVAGSMTRRAVRATTFSISGSFARL